MARALLTSGTAHLSRNEPFKALVVGSGINARNDLNPAQWTALTAGSRRRRHEMKTNATSHVGRSLVSLPHDFLQISDVRSRLAPVGLSAMTQDVQSALH